MLRAPKQEQQTGEEPAAEETFSDGAITPEQQNRQPMLTPETAGQASVPVGVTIAKPEVFVGSPREDGVDHVSVFEADKLPAEEMFYIKVSEQIRPKIGPVLHHFVPGKIYRVRKTVKEILHRRGVLAVV